ncbi:MAG: hypothetical protein ACRCT3_06055 [Aeromonas hydrophila]
MRLSFLYLLLIVACAANAADGPPNSHSSILGSGWDCDRGYYKSVQKCVKVVIPENASIDVYGSGWACNRGYYKSGQGCAKVQIPENADIDIYGSGWACNRGYYKSGQGCAKVQIPEHASIDVYGSGWTCNSGFKKSGTSCVPMTLQEIQKQKKLEKALDAEIQRRKVQGVSGDDCETEYKTNAEVCVEITGSDLNCDESHDGNYYNDCNSTLSYKLSTDYGGGAYLDVDVECSIEIEYKGRETYSTQTDFASQDESHSLYAHGSDSNAMSFNFSFSSHKEISSVKISSAQCKVDSIYLY